MLWIDKSVKREEAGFDRIVRHSMIFYEQKNCYFFQVSFSSRLLYVIVCFQVENIQMKIHLTSCLLKPNDRYIKYLFAFFCLASQLRYEK